MTLEEKGRCLADMTLLALSEKAKKTAQETYESTPVKNVSAPVKQQPQQKQGPAMGL